MKRSSLTEQAIALLTGRIAPFAFMFLLPMILVRLFSKHQFGLYREFFIIFFALYMLAQFGLSYALPSLIPRNREHTKEIIANTIFAQFLIAIILSFVGILLFFYGTRFGLRKEILPLVPIMEVFTGLMVASSPFDNILIIEERSKAAALLLIIWDLTRGSFILCGALYLMIYRWLYGERR